MLASGRPSEGESLELVGICKIFGSVAVLQRLDLAVQAGEFVSLVGPSGCGKTTTLNIIAGFIFPDAGEVRIGGRSVNGVPPHRRNLGMVFQSHALFPHMTVAENVAFGLNMRGTPPAEKTRLVGEALEIVRLTGFDVRYPRELSGGQQQRVGLARALTVRPRVLLLDEPLSSLDAKLRREMQIDLRSILRVVNTTAVYVTHDQEEALSLSDRVVLLNKGQIEQVGTPEEVYTRPASEFVAGFIGEATFFDAVVLEADGKTGHVELSGGGIVPITTAYQLEKGGRLRLAVRPDRVKLATRIDANTRTGLTGIVKSSAFVGPVLRCVVDVGGGRTLQSEVKATVGALLGAGTAVSVDVAPADWLIVKRANP
ncbi:MAG: ABC transporter ATP-binding protein [Bradyrhizobiaceae bacterium]|nr:ABC transporter ATP-binding protein [Bradyrhizobiaceae bacterium]